MEPMIEISNATKKYKETTALNKISLIIEKNKITGLIGRNGSGKTVLLKCICGLVSLTSGSITIQVKKLGADIEKPDNIGAIIENPGFLNEFSGYKNLEFLASIHHKIGKKDILKTLELVGLDSKSKKKVGKYSLGMKQRLGIAQAVMENPEILIFDEPTNGLDNNGVKEFRKLILQLKSEGKTIVMASHNASDIEMLCDIVYELDGGILINTNPKNNISF